MFPLSWCIVKAGNASLYTRPSSEVGSQVACQVASFTIELCFDVVGWIMSRICFPYGPGISCTCDQHRRILGCVPAHDEQVLPAPDRPALQTGNPHWPTEILLTLTIIFSFLFSFLGYQSLLQYILYFHLYLILRYVLYKCEKLYCSKLLVRSYLLIVMNKSEDFCFKRK